jgi:hypothetical protein
VRKSFPPFLTPPDEYVIHGGWHLETAQGNSLLPSEMQHWDYQTVLRLSASVQILRSKVLEACDLETDTRLVLLVTAHSDHTRTERPVSCLDVPPEDTFDLAVRVDLPGAELGGVLTLQTSLVAAAPRPSSDLAPFESASVLWRTRHRTHLQGISAQFPTDAYDFTLTNPSYQHAGWELRLDTTDPDTRFMSAARLTLNTSHISIQELLSGADNDSTRQLERMLRWDVTRQMVLVGLSMDETRASDFDPEATSVAGVLRNVIAAVWPTMTPDEVHTRYRHDPSRIELDLQHHCKVLG